VPVFTDQRLRATTSRPNRDVGGRAQRATIHACSDPAALERWIERAATATNADVLFEDDER
jgi:hypothetical protein